MDCNMDCNNDKNSQACVPFFLHENVVMHYNHANKRMLIALITVCVTFILTIAVFVGGYTVREKNWLDTINSMKTTPVTEVQDAAILEQPDQSPH